MIDKRSHKDENIIELLKQYGYTYISGKYKNSHSKFRCYDKEGYIV